MRLALVCVLIILMAPACGGPSLDTTVQAAAVRTTLDTLWTEYADAADRRDSVAFGGLFLEDAALVFSGAPTVTGRQAIQQFLVGLYSGIDVTRFRVTPDDLRIHGPLAVETGAFEQDYTQEGAPKTEVGRFALIAERGGDKEWRIRRLVALADSIKGSGSTNRPVP